MIRISPLLAAALAPKASGTHGFPSGLAFEDQPKLEPPFFMADTRQDTPDRPG